jgi:hypothetical protein
MRIIARHDNNNNNDDNDHSYADALAPNCYGSKKKKKMIHISSAAHQLRV